jgi:hypothetical protein
VKTNAPATYFGAGAFVFLQKKLKKSEKNKKNSFLGVDKRVKNNL